MPPPPINTRDGLDLRFQRFFIDQLVEVVWTMIDADHSVLAACVVCGGWREKDKERGRERQSEREQEREREKYRRKEKHVEIKDVDMKVHIRRGWMSPLILTNPLNNCACRT